MFAKVKQSFNGKPDSEPVSRLIAVGEVINGDLAAVAVREKWADEVPPNEKAAAETVVKPASAAKSKAKK
jgi:hypothetical protein